jgi:hypothetical protein
MIKIGIIGMSAGNAHPYSWSAIVNGFYDGDEISKVGYPGITNYLNANQDTLGIEGARMTHVWTQDRSISESIAKAARVEHIVDNMEDMIGPVDAVILARDDAENHVKMAAPFIEAGIPVFIDKPLAATYEDLAYFSEQHAQGKFIMSCSSMRYAGECRALKTDIASLGKIELVTAVGKKDWLKYGIHMLEALFAFLDDPSPVLVQHIGEDKKDVVYLEFENGIKTTVHLFMDIALTFQISVFGQKGWELVELKNYYSMFRDNLIEFIRSVQEGKPRLSFDKTERLMRTLIGAQESLKSGGKVIYL